MRQSADDVATAKQRGEPPPMKMILFWRWENTLSADFTPHSRPRFTTVSPLFAGDTSFLLVSRPLRFQNKVCRLYCDCYVFALDELIFGKYFISSMMAAFAFLDFYATVSRASASFT